MVNIFQKIKGLKARVIILIEVLVVFIILISSIINYYTIKSSLIKDLRENQLYAFVEAAQSDIQMVLERAMETSKLLANDPLLVEWFSSGEKNDVLGVLVKKKLDQVVEMGYITSFAVNGVTKNYWKDGGGTT